MSTTTQARARGTIARVAIQCIEPVSGKTGSFLFTAESHRLPGTVASPVFNDCVELFNWCRENGWRGVGDAYTYLPA